MTRAGTCFSSLLTIAVATGLAVTWAGPATAQANREVNVICSVQAAWCNIIATTFERSQGIKVNMTAKGDRKSVV